MRGLFHFTLIFICSVLLAQCKKKDCCPPREETKTNRLSYGDSIFYLRNADYAIRPVATMPAGTYTTFPNNLSVDRITGAITVTPKGTDGQSQAGMWYKIIFRASNSDYTDSTMIMVSGLSYIDRFYNLNQNDSIIYPIYNSDPGKALPTGNYDLTGDSKFAVNAANGQINIKESMRRGFFNSGTMGSGWKVATVKYALNDNSQQAVNKIDLVVYYYSTMADVPSNVSALMQAHQKMTLGLRQLPQIPSTTGPFDNNLPSDLSLSKPRPPCLVIIGH